MGTTTVAHALHRLLAERDVRHAVIEGDLLDPAHPAPWEHGLAERNLAAVWSNYRDLGYRRLIYTNTVALLEARTLALAADLAALIGWSPLSWGGAPSGSGGPGMTPSPTRPSEPARHPA